MILSANVSPRWGFFYLIIARQAAILNYEFAAANEPCLPAGPDSKWQIFFPIVISKERTRLRNPMLNSCYYAIHGISHRLIRWKRTDSMTSICVLRGFLPANGANVASSVKRSEPQSGDLLVEKDKKKNKAPEERHIINSSWPLVFI